MSVESVTHNVYVVVPVFNVERYLGNCLDSILNQSFPCNKIFVVDDGSTDSSGSICDKYASTHPTIYCVHQENQGLAGARNTGILMAMEDAGSEFRNGLISFIDSDDYVHPDMIASMVDVYSNTEGVSVVGVEAKTVYENDHPVFTGCNVSEYEVLDTVEFARRYLTHVASVSVCNKLFSLELFKNHLFAKDRLNEDGLLLYEIFLSEQCKYAQLPEKMYYYMMRDGSISRIGFGKSIVDMIGNFQSIEKITAYYAPQLKKEANDNMLYGCATYCYTVPISFFLRDLQGTSGAVIKEIRSRRETINNAYLCKRDKMVLRLVSHAPVLTITMLSLMRTIKKRSRG